MSEFELAIVQLQLLTLTLSMAQGTNVTITSNAGTYVGVCDGIHREDGSGHNFNITLVTPAGRRVMFVDLSKGYAVTQAPVAAFKPIE